MLDRGGGVDEVARLELGAALDQLAVGERLECFSEFGRRVTISVLSVMIAELRALTAVSRATLIWRTISAAPSALFGTAVAIPASTDRAAISASIVSLFPLFRRFRRSQ